MRPIKHKVHKFVPAVALKDDLNAGGLDARNYTGQHEDHGTHNNTERGLNHHLFRALASTARQQTSLKHT